MIKRVAFAVPGDLATPTGGYVYDRRIIDELCRLGWQVDVLDVGDHFPFPSAAQRTAALATMSAVPDSCPIIIDGLAFGVLPEAGALRARTPLIALVHLPLALNPDFDTAQACMFRDSERAALKAAARVITTSETIGRILVTDYGVPADRISVARPGNDPMPRAGGSIDGTVRLVSIGSVIPAKGFDILVAALARIANLPWILTIAGDRTRAPAFASQLESKIQAYGLGARVTILGAVSPASVMELYRVSDVFVCASRFESYGMAVAEAIAHGLPIVATRAGAIPETVSEGVGLLVPLDDVSGLAQALRQLISDGVERQRFATNARAAAARLPRWNEFACVIARTIETTTP